MNKDTLGRKAEVSEGSSCIYKNGGREIKFRRKRTEDWTKTVSFPVFSPERRQIFNICLRTIKRDFVIRYKKETDQWPFGF